MNIFTLHESPSIAATMHCDRHVIEMNIKYSIILAAAHRMLDGKPGTLVMVNKPGLYNWVLPDEDGKHPRIPLITDIGHPCLKWAQLSTGNYLWILYLYLALRQEFYFRFGRHHGFGKWFEYYRQLPENLPPGDLTPFTQHMGKWYRNENAVLAHRRHYRNEFREVAAWKKRQVPLWFSSPNL